MKKCSYCGCENKDTSIYCIECGIKLDLEKQEKEVIITETITCKECGEKNDSQNSFCYHCGFKLEKEDLKKLYFSSEEKEQKKNNTLKGFVFSLISLGASLTLVIPILSQIASIVFGILGMIFTFVNKKNNKKVITILSLVFSILSLVIDIVLVILYSIEYYPPLDYRISQGGQIFV